MDVFDAGIRLKHACGQGNDSHQIVLYQHLAQACVGLLALEDNAFRYDDSSATSGIQMLGHIVHEQDLAAFGFHRKAVVGPDTSLGRHERRIGQNHVGVLVPSIFAGQGIVFEDVRIDEAVQVHVYQGQAHHIGRDVVALEIPRKFSLFVGRERTVSLVVRVGVADMFIG